MRERGREGERMKKKYLAPAMRKFVLDVGGGEGVVSKVLAAVGLLAQFEGRNAARVSQKPEAVVDEGVVGFLGIRRPDKVLELALLELSQSKEEASQHRRGRVHECERV
jgi:hypothetical protein